MEAKLEYGVMVSTIDFGSISRGSSPCFPTLLGIIFSLQTERIVHVNHFLAFQIEELRDKFLKNFKDLIEIAKDLI